MAFSAVEVGVEAFGEVDGLQCIQKYLFFDPEIPEGTDGHISGNSGKTIKVENSHGNFL